MRAVAVALGDDAGDLGGGAAGLFALERHRQLQHVQVDAGPANPRVGQQRVEPADPPPTDPTVQGVTAHPHPLTGRAEVSRSASARTSAPRSRVLSAGSAASRISE
jgi:hypothetical protein